MRRRTAVRHVRQRHLQRVALALLALSLGLAVTGGGSAAERTATYSGYGFDACNAPKPATLQAWLASPYRALGIYIGGANRACANDQLSPDWVGRRRGDAAGT